MLSLGREQCAYPRRKGSPSTESEPKWLSLQMDLARFYRRDTEAEAPGPREPGQGEAKGRDADGKRPRRQWMFPKGEKPGEPGLWKQ